MTIRADCPVCFGTGWQPIKIGADWLRWPCQACIEADREHRPEPDRSREHVIDLHRRLRAFLIATMPHEAPDSIACALMYELVSITATMAESKAQARALLDDWIPIARHQIETYGVGTPHP